MEVSCAIPSEKEGWESVHCTAHCLQICLNAALSISVIDKVLGMSKNIVRLFSHSVVATKELKKMVRMSIPEKKLIQDVITHWNSSYCMLQRLLETQYQQSCLMNQSRKDLSEILT